MISGRPDKRQHDSVLCPVPVYCDYYYFDLIDSLAVVVIVVDVRMLPPNGRHLSRGRSMGAAILYALYSINEFYFIFKSICS